MTNNTNKSTTIINTLVLRAFGSGTFAGSLKTKGLEVSEPYQNGLFTKSDKLYRHSCRMIQTTIISELFPNSGSTTEEISTNSSRVNPFNKGTHVLYFRRWHYLSGYNNKNKSLKNINHETQCRVGSCTTTSKEMWVVTQKGQWISVMVEWERSDDCSKRCPVIRNRIRLTFYILVWSVKSNSWLRPRLCLQY